MSFQTAVFWNVRMVEQERRDTLGGCFIKGVAKVVRVGARLGGVMKRMHLQTMMAVRGESPLCPDGESHHPSVCTRGWRGDICYACPFCEIASKHEAIVCSGGSVDRV